jgi:hypothetical protein
MHRLRGIDPDETHLFLAPVLKLDDDGIPVNYSDTATFESVR